MSNTTSLDLLKLGRGAHGGGNSILGLSWEGGRLDCAWLKRVNGSLTVVQSISVPLTLDPLTNDPALVGREIRNALHLQNIRERSCVFAVPLKWVITTHVPIPSIPEQDIPGFLQIEAERTLPSGIETVYMTTSRYTAADGAQHATIIAVPRSHVDSMDAVLRAAQLRPVSFTLAPTAMQPISPAGGVLALIIGETYVGLQLAMGGGIAALRVLEGAFEETSGRHDLRADSVAREVRITLGQFSPLMREPVRQVRIFGPRDMAQQLADIIELRLDAMELQMHVPGDYRAMDLGLQTAANAATTWAYSVAARRLANQASPFEFLPPRVTTWQQFSRKYSSGKLQQAGIAAGVVIAILLGLFGYQQWQLMSAEREWNAMKTQVTELRDLQRRLAHFRPWSDETLKGMTILKSLAEAFPEDGAVTAKLLEIRDPGSVICSGVARDYQALIGTVERLRRMPQIPDVSLGQTRGASPALQFTFGFAWVEGGRRAD